MMQPRLLDFLACPDCRSAQLYLHVIKGHRDDRRVPEIEEGSLVCTVCDGTYLINAGIPRMLPKDLRGAAPMANHEWVEGTLRTAQGYDTHHLRNQSDRSQDGVAPTGHAADLDLARQNFCEYLALEVNELHSLEGRVVLDAGCGGGRFMAAAREYGVADVVGLDLSEGGLLHAQALLDGIDGVHLVQGDITRPPFRSGIFDVIYSIGVLHHLASPHDGFRALQPLLPPGGRLWIWVYGLEGMSLVYRLSHLVWLRRLTSNWSLAAKFRLCRWFAHTFRLSYLSPLRLTQRLFPAAVVSHFPYATWTGFSYDDIAYAFFDRLQPPYTHYLKKTDLQEWLSDLCGLSIERPHQHGWVAKGQR
jgi:SAM-dependent methyltransferase/uncharacterized protein YbaR (Trm112 family)